MSEKDLSEFARSVWQAPASEPNRGAAYRMRGNRDWHVCSMSELAQVIAFPGIEWMELVNANPGRVYRNQCSGCGSRESMQEINLHNPKALGCCPERHMVTVLAPLENDTPLADIVDTCQQMKQMMEAFDSLPESYKEEFAKGIIRGVGLGGEDGSNGN